MLERPRERGPGVVVLGLDEIEPDVVPDDPFRLEALGELGQPLCMPQPHLGGSGFLEPLDREMADRLEHHEAGVAPPKQVVVDERAEGLERRLADLLRSLERAAADEDAEPDERQAFLRVRVGRSSSGSSPRACCCRAGASRGPAGSRFGSRSSRSSISRRREQLRARRGELDGERQPVEPAADARDLGRACRCRARSRDRRPGRAPRRAVARRS